MAIAFEGANDGATQSAGTTLSWNHTQVGNLLVVQVLISSGAATVSTITFNSVASDGNVTVSANGWRNYLFWWFNPATGSHAVDITVDTFSFFVGRSASYSGVETTHTPETNTGSSAGATSLTVSVTTTVNDSWLVGVCENHTEQEFAGTGTIMRTDNTQGDGLFDSNGPKTPAGSFSLQATSTNSVPWSGVVAAFAPIVEDVGFLLVKN